MYFLELNYDCWYDCANDVVLFHEEDVKNLYIYFTHRNKMLENLHSLGKVRHLTLKVKNMCAVIKFKCIFQNAKSFSLFVKCNSMFLCYYHFFLWFRWIKCLHIGKYRCTSNSLHKTADSWPHPRGHDSCWKHYNETFRHFSKGWLCFFGWRSWGRTTLYRLQ